MSVCYDVEITEDPTGKNPYAYFISTPGDMNFEDATGTRLLRLPYVMGTWYLQNEAKATMGILSSKVPDSMSIGKAYLDILTDDPDLGRPHLYHAPDSRLAYPYNIGCEIEDDRDQNNDSTKWCPLLAPGIPGCRSVRRLTWSNVIKAITLFGVLGYLFTLFWKDTVGPLSGSCSFEVISRQSITCPDGKAGEILLYRANDCSTHTYNSCTGEDQQKSEPPKAAQNALLILGGIGIFLISIGGAWYLVSRAKAEKEKRKT